MSERVPDTRGRILEAAFDVIASVGLDGFTMTEVERRVGLAVGTGSIYRHFPSKEALIQAAVEHRVAVNRSGITEARAALEDVADPDERRRLVYKETLEDLGGFDKIFGLMLTYGDRVDALRETIRTAVSVREPTGSEQERALHIIAMAALGGYHLFSEMEGQPFHGVSEDEFIELLASIRIAGKGKF